MEKPTHLVPSFRQPSSIEKILCEAEREHNFVFKPPTPKGSSSTSAPSTPIRPASPRVSSQRHVSSPRAVSPMIVQRREFVLHRPEPTLLVKKASATNIQAAFRDYMARRSFRALKGLVRLQGVVRGHTVKLQTMNAMKYMQILVRVHVGGPS